MSEPLVSIQIPTYNQQKYIKECVQSAVEQEYPHKEIIVADDASPAYDIASHLKEYVAANLIKLLDRKQNLGRVGNYHATLFDHVQGKYFANLDGDDYYTDPAFLSFGIALLEQTQDRNTVIYEADHNLDRIKNIVQEFEEIGPDALLINGKKYFEHINAIGKFSHASCIFRTETAKAIDFYSVDALSTDFNSAVRILLEGNIIVSSRKVVHWREHEHNETWSLSEEKYAGELNTIKSITEAAKGKIAPAIRAKVDRELRLGLFLKTLGIFESGKNYRSGFRFIAKRGTLRKEYIWPSMKFFIKSLIKR